MNRHLFQNELPLLPPSAQVLETTKTLKACLGERASLAELKQSAELLQNQSLLINLLPLLEARDSSEIENILTTTGKLFQHATEHRDADPATQEALRYRTALRQGFEQLANRPGGGEAEAQNEEESVVHLIPDLLLNPYLYY